MEWYILVLGTIFFATFGTIIEKKTLFKEHAMEFCTVFAIFMALLSLTLFPFLNLSFPTHYWWLLIIIGILDAFGFLLIAKATRHMELSSSSPLLAFSPAIIALLGFLFLRESLSLSQVGGIFLILSGSYILELKKKKSFKEEFLTPFKVMLKSKYIHYLFLAMLLYAFSAVLGRFLLNASNPYAMEPRTFFVIFHFLVAIIMIILTYVFYDGFHGIAHGIRNAGGWIALMAILVFSGRFLLVYAVSFPAAKIALVSSLKRTSTIFSTFLGGGLFKEKRVKQKTFAATIMVLGAILVLL